MQFIGGKFSWLFGASALCIGLQGCGAKLQETTGAADRGEVAFQSCVLSRELGAPPLSDAPDIARTWFRLEEHFAERPSPPEGRVRVRATHAFVTGGRHLLDIDWETRTLCQRDVGASSGERVLDVLAPAGSSLVIALVGAEDTRRKLRVSTDAGANWRSVEEPSHNPSSLLTAVPSVLVASDAGRLFASYGGPTIDVAEQDGLRWSRYIESGGSAPTYGLALNHAQTVLWCISEGFDWSMASWTTLSPTPTSVWNNQKLEGWGGGGVNTLEADPTDPAAMYIGGRGRLGHLVQPTEGPLRVDVRWADEGTRFGYINALLPDPEHRGQVLFGGDVHDEGGARARLLRSRTGGAEPAEVRLEHDPSGAVRGLAVSPAPTQLLIVVAGLHGSLQVLTLQR